MAPEIVTATPGEGVSRLPESSTARLRIVTLPSTVGVQLYDQFEVPLARCHVLPPSTDTSTPPTWPATSDALPVIVTGVPVGKLPPPPGEVMTDDGGVVSDEAEARVSPGCRENGCAPMSASTFTVAC